MVRHLKIGICCYPTFGGSGIVATELGLALAARGHRIHFITTGVPRRLNHCPSNVTLHEVAVRSYPMFSQPPYSLALASKLVAVAKWKQLDILHVHYAIPHAASAVMAKDILGSDAPKLVTTLHGTDVTMLAHDEDYRPVIRWSIDRSDAVTTPSQWLLDDVCSSLKLSQTLSVIPNFVDVEQYTPEGRDRDVIQGLFVGNGYKPLAPHHPVLVHVSNFRPVKQVHQVIEMFHRVNQSRESRLVLVGDGPQRSQVEAQVRRLGLEHHVRFVGKVRDVVRIVRAADLFVLPSASESFGLAALEAQACGVPVIASAVGGLPEVIVHQETGILTQLNDVQAMAEAAVALLDDPARLDAMRRASRERAVERFQRDAVVEQYEQLYMDVLE